MTPEQRSVNGTDARSKEPRRPAYRVLHLRRRGHRGSHPNAPRPLQGSRGKEGEEDARRTRLPRQGQHGGRRKRAGCVLVQVDPEVSDRLVRINNAAATVMRGRPMHAGSGSPMPTFVPTDNRVGVQRGVSYARTPMKKWAALRHAISACDPRDRVVTLHEPEDLDVPWGHPTEEHRHVGHPLDVGHECDALP